MPDLKNIHVKANDEIFHLPALSELVVKITPHTLISVDVAPTIQPRIVSLVKRFGAVDGIISIKTYLKGAFGFH